jgi:3-methyl-2-oxobutanoate hydroxymethyltransferase
LKNFKCSNILTICLLVIFHKEGYLLSLVIFTCYNTNMNNRITISDLIEAKRNNNKIAAVSCYDFLTARIVSQTDIEMIIVGDSASQLVLGFDSTMPVTMDFMVDITSAVRRGAPNLCLVADMPFLSYQVTIPEAIRNAGRFITESGVQMVKIEATSTQIDVIKAVSDAGIAVMAHIGIRPQSISKVGRFKAEATTAEMAAQLINLSELMIQAGASSILLEGTASEVAEIITQKNEVPVISCGSGPHCDGQVLVAPDILGMTHGPSPKFAKSYDNLSERTLEAFQKYCKEIKSSEYPDKDHSYHMKSGEIEKLKKILDF